MGHVRGHGSLQNILGRSIPVPKRKRDDEEDHLQGDPSSSRAARVAKPPPGTSQSGKPPAGQSKAKGLSKLEQAGAKQAGWDWKTNKPIPRTADAPSSSNSSALTPPKPHARGRAQPNPCSPAPGDLNSAATRMCCFLTGARHRSVHVKEVLQKIGPSGVAVLLAREPDNPVDSNAVQVVLKSPAPPAADPAAASRDGDMLMLGHVPAKLAAHLAPLMDQGQVVITAHLQPAASSPTAAAPHHGNSATRPGPTTSPVAQGPGSGAAVHVKGCSPQAVQHPANQGPDLLSRPAAPLPPPSRSRPAQPPALTLRLSCEPAPGLRGQERQAVVAQLVSACSTCAELAAVQDAGHVMRTKFGHMLAQLMELDSHLFSSAELQVMQVYQALQPNQQALLLRLFIRKGPWFVLRDVEYAEVGPSEAAAAALVATSLLSNPGKGDCPALVGMLSASKAFEVAQLLGLLTVSSSTKRPDMNKCLLEACTCSLTKQQQVLHRCVSASGRATPAGQALRSEHETGSWAAAGVRASSTTGGQRRPGLHQRASAPGALEAALCEVVAAAAAVGMQENGDAGAKERAAAGEGAAGRVAGTGDARCSEPPSTPPTTPSRSRRTPSKAVFSMSDGSFVDPILIDSPFKAAAVQAMKEEDEEGDQQVHGNEEGQEEAQRVAGQPGPSLLGGQQLMDVEHAREQAQHELTPRPSPQERLHRPAQHARAAVKQEQGLVKARQQSRQQETCLIDLTADDDSDPVQLNGTSTSCTPRQARAAHINPPGSARPAVLPVRDAEQGMGTESAGARSLKRSVSDGAALTGPGCVLQQRVLELLGPCVRLPPLVSTLLQRMQRVYFLNEAHDISRWVATERGVICFPPYKVWRTRSAFPSRQALLLYESALAQAGRLDDCLTTNDLEGAHLALAPAWAALEAGDLARLQWTETQDVQQQQQVEGGGHREEQPVVPSGSVDQASTSRSPTGSLKHRTGTKQRKSASPVGVQPHVCSGVQPTGTDDQHHLPLYLARYCAAWVYAGMCTVGVSLHEKTRDYQAAIKALRALLAGNCCPGRRGEWWLRLSIDLEHLGQDEEALCVAEQALKDPWVRHGNLLALKRRVLRLGKPPRRWKKPGWAAAVNAEPPEIIIQATPLAGNTGVKSRFYSSTVEGKQVSVEALALEHYLSDAGGGWCGLHCEGGVWSCMVGLLLWDCLFSEVPDVFRTPFQTAPLDLGTDAFYPARRHQIDVRLQQIADGGAQELIAKCWAVHKGQWCRGVNWERYSLDVLLEIARCVGGLGLSVVCRMLSEDYSGWSGGMPDLLLWRPQKGDAKLVEVKGPRDRLSESQRAWISALDAVGVRCEVLRVQEVVKKAK